MRHAAFNDAGDVDARGKLVEPKSVAFLILGQRHFNRLAVFIPAYPRPRTYTPTQYMNIKNSDSPQGGQGSGRQRLT